MISISETLAILLAIITIVYIWVERNYSYWSRKNVPFIKPLPFFGNLKEMILYTNSAGAHMQNLYNDKEVESAPIVGIYVLNKPGLLIREPQLIKQILVKDFNKFSDRFAASDPHSDGLGANNLFFVKNPRWKQIRTKLTPVFTSGKIKQVFPLIAEIGSRLDDYLCSLPIDPVTKASMQEVKEICALYTTDVIATAAYGVDANSLKNPDGDFRTNGRRIFDFSLWRAFEFNAFFFAPQLVSLFRCKVFSPKSTKFIRDTINFVIEERIKSGQIRNDLIDVLVEFKKSAEADKNKEHFNLEGDALIAQAAIFFTAGFETTSSTMSFTLYEISKNKSVQDRLREEIREALHKSNGKITYDVINDMEYLNMIIQEVLRLYPTLPFLDRECTLEKNETGFSLKPYSDFEVPHGMPVYIPIYAIQRDKKYWSDPDKFDPERFSPANKNSHTPFTYMPFGTGPHNCIGERFGLIQTKIGLINFLKNHYVIPCEKSYSEMILNRKALLTQSEGGIFCNIVRDDLLKEKEKVVM